MATCPAPGIGSSMLAMLNWLSVSRVFCLIWWALTLQYGAWSGRCPSGAAVRRGQMVRCGRVPPCTFDVPAMYPGDGVLPAGTVSICGAHAAHAARGGNRLRRQREDDVGRRVAD